MPAVQRVSPLPFLRNFMRVENIVALMMSGVGWSMTFRPDSPLGQYIASYLSLVGISNQAFGLFMICCSLAVSQGPDHGNFILLTSPLLTYLVFTIAYFLVTPNLSPSFVFIYAGTYGLMLCHYFTRHPRHDPHRRTGQ